MKKNVEVYLGHILESIDFIDKYITDCSKKEFLNSWEKKDAVTRRLEIIGEAVKRIPDDIKIDHPKIPWKKISGTRDKLIHDYFGVDYELTWNIAINELPKLKKQIEKVVRKLEFRI